MSVPSGKWAPAGYAKDTVLHLLDTQFEKYTADVEKASKVRLDFLHTCCYSKTSKRALHALPMLMHTLINVHFCCVVALGLRSGGSALGGERTSRVAFGSNSSAVARG